MPDLNEFFYKPELIKKAELETIHGIKPCGKCDENVDEAYWDPTTLILAWECSNGHKNQVKVN